MTNVNYDVYVSYCYNDNSDKWIAGLIELIKRNLNILSDNKMNIYFDQNINSCDVELDVSIKNIISNCHTVLLFITPSYFNCDYCSKEWNTISDEQFIVPIYLKDVIHFPGITQNEDNVWKYKLAKKNIIDIRDWSIIRGPSLGTQALNEIMKHIGESIVNHLRSSQEKAEYEDLAPSYYSSELKTDSHVDINRLQNLLKQPSKSVRVEVLKEVLVLSSQTKRPSKYLDILKDYALDSINDTKSRSIAINCFSKVILEKNSSFLRDIALDKSNPTRMRVTAIKALSYYTKYKSATQKTLRKIFLDLEEIDSIINAAVKTFLKISNQEDLPKLQDLISHRMPKVRLESILFFVKYINKNNISIIEPLIYDDEPDIKIVASFLYSKIIGN